MVIFKELATISTQSNFFISHGYGEHIGRYEHVSNKLNSHGFAVYGLDHQGHGQSEGDRAHVEYFSHFTRDLLTYVRKVQHTYPSPLPCFLLGHSMGGLIAIQTIRQCVAERKGQASVWPWEGLILSAPAVVPDPSVAKPALVALSGFFAQTLPKLPFNQLDSKWVSRDLAVVYHYQHDLLNYHGGIRARFGYEFLQTMMDVQRNAGPALTLPLLILHGSKDKLALVQGAQLVYDTALSLNKTIKIYPDNYHELFNDLDKARVFDDMIAWLNNRVS